MWITKQLAAAESVRLTSGEVESNGSEVSVRGESYISAPEQLFPYGFSSAAVSGGKMVMLDGYCAGLSSISDPALKEGEVRLYSSGGAEILLKSNGAVVINGQEFRKTE